MTLGIFVVVASAAVFCDASDKLSESTRNRFGRKPLVLPRDRFGNPDYCFITKRHTMCNSEVIDDGFQDDE